MKKRFLSAFLGFMTAMSCLPFSALSAERPAFSDVSSNDWFAPYVDVCVEEELMQGTGEGNFSPLQHVTTGECVLLAVRLDRLQKGLEGPLPQAPEGWGSVIVTGEDGAVLFGTEDYKGYRSSGDEDVIFLPPDAVKPLVGQAGTLTVNGTVSFDGQFVINQDPEEDWDWAGLAFHGLTYREFESITDGYYLAGSLASAPDWVWDGVYYAQEAELGLGYLAPELSLYPATRLGFLTALEGVTDPRELEPINTVEVLPDIPADDYTTWSDSDGRSGISGDFGDFYRAGILSGTDQYGTFHGDWPLTRAEAAAMLARLLRPELRLRFTLTPYPWDTGYELVDLGLSSEDWWNGGHTNWIFPVSVESLLDLQLLRVSRRDGFNIDYGQDGVFSPEGEWLVEPGLYRDIGNFGPDGLALVSSPNHLGTTWYGVIDRRGREVLEPVYSTIGLGGDGFIVAGNEWYVVLDQQGQHVGSLPQEAFGVCGVREGLALYRNEDQLWGYMDLEGQVVIPARFELAGLFYDGLAAVVLDGKLGYIDASGELVIPCQFKAIGQHDECHFQNGAAIVTDSDGLALVIDRQGHQISPRRYDLLSDNFSPNGFAFYQYMDEEKEAFGEGFIDTRGQEHPLPEYDNPYQFMAYSGGYYLVYWTAGGSYNYMDQQGKLLFSHWFSEASPLTEDGRAIVLDQNGNYCRLELK